MQVSGLVPVTDLTVKIICHLAVTGTGRHQMTANEPERVLAPAPSPGFAGLNVQRDRGIEVVLGCPCSRSCVGEMPPKVTDIDQARLCGAIVEVEPGTDLPSRASSDPDVCAHEGTA